MFLENIKTVKNRKDCKPAIKILRLCNQKVFDIIDLFPVYRKRARYIATLRCFKAFWLTAYALYILLYEVKSQGYKLRRK